MSQTLILALDIGTSSVRAGLYDEPGNPVPRMSVKLERSLTSTTDGGSEIDAPVAFDQVVAAIDALLTKANKIKGEIGYVASCSFWHSLVGIDERARPTTKVFSWADTRSREYTAVLRKRFDESDVHSRTGAQFHSSFWPARLLWLRKESPEVFAKTDKWLSLTDYIDLRLFGSLETSVSMASGTGVFDIRKCEWDRELLRYLKVSAESLPGVADDSRVFKLSRTFAKRWPRLADASWFPSIADGAADNIGSGCIGRGRAALMVGTSGAMRVAYAGDPPSQIPDGLWCYRVDHKRVVIGGALSDGGGLYQWLKANLKIKAPDAEIGAEIARRGADAHGLTVMPFFFGERSTGYHEGASGSITGLTASHDSIDILQAGIEAVAYRFAEIYDRLKKIMPIKEIVASGGALSQSPVWTQIISDVLGRDLLIGSTSESSSRGAVLLALETIGKIEKIEVAPAPTLETKSYHPKCHATYKIARKRHREIYRELIQHASRLKK